MQFIKNSSSIKKIFLVAPSFKFLYVFLPKSHAKKNPFYRKVLQRVASRNWLQFFSDYFRKN